MTRGPRPSHWGSNLGSRWGGPHVATPAANPLGVTPQATPVTPPTAAGPTSPHGEPQRHHRQQRLRAPAELLQIASRLTERDLQIAAWLYRHDVFTTDQIARAFFTSPITARHRLTALHHIHWIARFHRPRPGGGTTPWHWVIGPLGAQWHAAARGENPPTAEALRKRWAQHAASPLLTHRLGIHDFFTDLHTPTLAIRLAWWWSARETADRFLQRIHPDGTGRYGQTRFFLEHDTGTEPITRLITKLDAYTALHADGGPAWPVLFHLPNPRREANLPTALGRIGLTIPVATTVHGNHPAAKAWRLAGNGQRRHHLTTLPNTPASNPIYRDETL
jgi:hypothetical protein